MNAGGSEAISAKDFEDTLPLAHPWYVDRVTAEPEERCIEIHLEFEPGERFSRATCGTEDCGAYDRYPLRWRHLDFFDWKAFLCAPVPRVECPGCGGIRKAEVPWARPRVGLTRQFEQWIVRLAEEMPMRAVARLVGEHDTRLRRIIVREPVD